MKVVSSTHIHKKIAQNIFDQIASFLVLIRNTPILFLSK